MNRFEVQLRPPFDAGLSLQFWQRAEHEQVDRVAGNRYSRLFFRDDRPVVLSIETGGSIEKPLATVAVAGDTRPEDTGWAMETARWILNDDAPVQAFYDHIEEHDQRLFSLARKLPGLRSLQSPAVFDTMVFAVLGQQVNVSFAYTCKKALEDSFARTAEIDGEQWCAGIEPDDLAGVEIEQLRALRISNSKSRTILELAAAFRDLSLDRSMLTILSDEEVEESLTAMWGIGSWTARYTLMRSLAAVDVLPVGDAGLRNAVYSLYNLPEKPDTETIVRIAESWRPFRSLATYYLWHASLATEQ